MEDWSFPPAYDAGYLPPAESRYWFPQRETMPASGTREGDTCLAFVRSARYAYDTSPFYRRRWDEAGSTPITLRSLEDFESKRPRRHQGGTESSASGERRPSATISACRRARSFTSMARAARRAARRLSPSAATTGMRSPMRMPASCGGWVCVRATSICIAAIFSLYMGSWGALAGAERLGAKAFPFGAGAAGHDARAARNGSTSLSRRLSMARRPMPCIWPGPRSMKASIRAVRLEHACFSPASRAPRSLLCAARSRNSTAPRSSTAARWAR